jgi:hypothetical protein
MSEERIRDDHDSEPEELTAEQLELVTGGAKESAAKSNDEQSVK